MKLVDIILSYQNGNNDLILELLEKFKFKIRKLSNKLSYEYAETDLTIYFIELINSINIKYLSNTSDGAIVKYIDISLNRKATKLYRLNSSTEYMELEYNDEIELNPIYLESDEISFYEVLSCLNDMQRRIIIYKYMDMMSFSEIASKIGISRQSVYLNKKKAIAKLKNITL